jgi:hypothetical protein
MTIPNPNYSSFKSSQIPSYTGNFNIHSFNPLNGFLDTRSADWIHNAGLQANSITPFNTDKFPKFTSNNQTLSFPQAGLPFQYTTPFKASQFAAEFNWHQRSANKPVSGHSLQIQMNIKPQEGLFDRQWNRLRSEVKESLSPSRPLYLDVERFMRSFNGPSNLNGPGNNPLLPSVPSMAPQGFRMPKADRFPLLEPSSKLKETPQCLSLRIQLHDSSNKRPLATADFQITGLTARTVEAFKNAMTYAGLAEMDMDASERMQIMETTLASRRKDAEATKRMLQSSLAPSPERPLGRVTDLVLSTLANPRFQGSMQVIGGIGEVGGGIYMTFQTAGFGAAVGFPAIAHGLDQMNAGVGKVITGKYQPTATEQLLVKAGVRPAQAVLIDSLMSIAATAGAIGATKPLQAANYPKYNLLPSNAPAGGAYNRATFEEYKVVLRSQMEKPYVVDPQLKDHIEVIYRPNAKVGSGSTAAAIRQELETGKQVCNKFHSQKGKEMVKVLEKWLKNNPTAGAGDRAAAENIVRDLKNALGE